MTKKLNTIKIHTHNEDKVINYLKEINIDYKIQKKKNKEKII